MKLYIRAVSIEDMQKKYPDIPKRKFAQLVDVDPTANYAENKRGKYMPWVFKQYKLGNLVTEDGRDQSHNVHDALQMFAKNNSSFPEKDLNRYKTVQEFLDAFEVANNTPRQLSKRQKAREAHKALKQSLVSEDNDGIEFLASDGDWEVYTPKTWVGSIALATVGCDKSKPYLYPEASPDNMKARWCTAGEGSDHYYNYYTGFGPLYIFINRNDPINKFQCCPAHNDWWYNKNDDPGTREEFFDFCAEHPQIANYFGVTFDGGVTTFQGKVVGYDKTATTITVPEGTVALPNFPIPDACTTVILPDTLTSIPSRAFMNSNIVTLKANNIDRIGPNAFNNSAITNIDLSGVNGRIGSNAFANCKNLTNVTLGTPAIGPCAFAGSGIRGEITITPEMNLDMMAFDGCPNVTVVWNKEDEPYRFFNTAGASSIKLLVLSQDRCPKLFETNEGKVDMELM